MKLKDSFTICLISFFSATLVMLIARSMDSQAASRLEPHLLRIADRLESLQAAGGLSAVAAEKGFSATPNDGLVVHYFHSSTRCVTCEAIESQTEVALQKHFQSQLAAGVLAWKTSNYEEPQNADLASQFEIIMPVVVITQYVGGELKQWKRLDEVWGLVSNEAKFSQFIQDNVNQILSRADSQPKNTNGASEAESIATIPLPNSDGIPLPMD